MAMFSLSRAARWLDARLVGADAVIESVGTDTRGIRSGQLFVALVGPRFDGHDFAEQARIGGAVALLVSRELDIRLPQLLVDDTRLALGRLAAAWRDKLQGKVIALTGSNGKTTTKEMIAAVLGRVGRVCATQGNLNNDIGLPLTLLSARDEDFLVLEMGANHPGEIAALSAIARPDLALITNAGQAHLLGFGGLEGVARAKGEIIGGLSQDGIFLLNVDDAWAHLWRDLAAGRAILSFGHAGDARVRIGPQRHPLRLNGDGFHNACEVITPHGEFTLDLALPGAHNRMNALAAIAVGEALGVDSGVMRVALRGLRPVPGRMQALDGRFGGHLIDDSYNANPDSVRAALDVLGELPGRRWLVLGDLAELGRAGPELHAQVGRMAKQMGLERLWAVGELSREAVAGFGEGARHFGDRESLCAELENNLGSEDLVLVKGSRSAAMEWVAQALVMDGEA